MTPQERADQLLRRTKNELHGLRNALELGGLVAFPITVTLEGKHVRIDSEEDARDVLDVYSDMLD
jgi:hypothetical protein